MATIVYKFVRTSAHPSTQVSNFALVTAISLGGIVLTLLMIHFGLDYGAGIPG